MNEAIDDAFTTSVDMFYYSICYWHVPKLIIKENTMVGRFFMRLSLVVAAFFQLSCASSGVQEVKGSQKAKVSNVSNQFWWPERLDLAPLRQHSLESNPMGKNFNYSSEFKKLDLNALKKIIIIYRQPRLV